MPGRGHWSAMRELVTLDAPAQPLAWPEAGQPVRRRYGDEATLFRLAAQLEEAGAWADRSPPVAAAASADSARNLLRVRPAMLGVDGQPGLHAVGAPFFVD